MIYDSCVFSATAAAVPFLVELAADPGVLVPEDCLGTVAFAAVCEGRQAHRPDGVRRAVARQTRALTELLDHPDPTLRTYAAVALGHADPSRACVGRVLNAHRLDEPDPGVRAVLLVSSVICDPTRGRTWVRQAYQDEDPQVRAAALHAGASLDLPWTADTTGVLHSSLLDGDPLDRHDYWSMQMRWWLPAVLVRLPPETLTEVLEHLTTSQARTVRRVGLRAADSVLSHAMLAAVQVGPMLLALGADDDPEIAVAAEGGMARAVNRLGTLSDAWRWRST